MAPECNDKQDDKQADNSVVSVFMSCGLWGDRRSESQVRNAVACIATINKLFCIITITEKVTSTEAICPCHETYAIQKCICRKCFNTAYATGVLPSVQSCRSFFMLLFTHQVVNPAPMKAHKVGIPHPSPYPIRGGMVMTIAKTAPATT